VEVTVVIFPDELPVIEPRCFTNFIRISMQGKFLEEIPRNSTQAHEKVQQKSENLHLKTNEPQKSPGP
jgi:hypothetical protein